MKQNKKLLPVWLLISMDVILITIYVSGFYYFYYLTPRQLESSGVKSNQAGQADTKNGTNLSEAENSGSAAGGANPANESETTELSNTTDAETTETAETADNLRSKFVGHFTDTVVSTQNSYTSKDISIQIKKYSEGSGGNIVTYYVADIYLADITCLQSGFAKDTYGIGYADELLDMDKSFNAILAINGDYYGNGGNGVVIRNGEVYRKNKSDSDVCVLYYDGTMKTYSADEFDVDEAIAGGAYQAWSFGPELLNDNGSSMSAFTTDSHIKEVNPRTAIGYYEPGHYAMIVVDGRQSGYSIGLTLTQFSDLFEGLGCKAAYNLDGGKSSEMSFNNELVNQPTDGGREVSDCIMIKEVK